MGNASDTEVWTQRDGLSIDCEQLVILIQKEEDWPALDSELDEIQAVSKEFFKLSIAYIPRSLKFRTNSLAKGVRSRASRSAFVNPFAPSWLAPQASMRVPKKKENKVESETKYSNEQIYHKSIFMWMSIWDKQLFSDNYRI